jgi:hypothetical protein
MQPINTVNPTIYLAIELSASTWLIAARLPGSEKPHLHRIEGGDTAALFALISSLRARVARRLDAAIGVVCCFEAGRMVRVPTPEDEDAKRIHRERENLVQEKLSLRTELKHCCSPRAFGKGPLFVHGSAILPSCAPVTGARCRAIFGPNWTACVDGLLRSWS